MKVDAAAVTGWVAAFAAAASAGIAAWQLRQTRIDANRRQAIELVRDMGVRLEALHSLDLSAVQVAVQKAYSESAPLEDGGRAYLAFLHSVELLADALERGVVDRQIAGTYLDSLVRADVVPLSVLQAIQSALGDADAYSNTRRVLIRNWK